MSPALWQLHSNGGASLEAFKDIRTEVVEKVNVYHIDSHLEAFF